MSADTRVDETDVLSDMRLDVRATAQAFGLHAVADAIADSAVDRFRARVGGERVYIRKHDMRTRDAQIRAEFDGRNVRDLARKYGLSVRHVRRLVQEKRT